jgi:FixJ family two-component response regulator
LSAQPYLIAVVDDEPGVLIAIYLMLSSCGYRTALFTTAEEFLSAAATSEAACVVIDIQLGNSSGVELARRLSAMGFKFPIIFMTESPDEKHRQQAMDIGCAAFLLKPFPADRLSEAIRRALGLKLH